MRPAPLLLTLALGLAAMPSHVQAAAPPSWPDWLAGHWCSLSGSAQVEEHWLPVPRSS